MRILAVLGSPRKGGNTEILVDEILKGAELKGHATERLRLYDYEILALPGLPRLQEARIRLQLRSLGRNGGNLCQIGTL